MTNEEIKRLRALCEAATPGPWSVQDHPGCRPGLRVLSVERTGTSGWMHRVSECGSYWDQDATGTERSAAMANAAFIAVARTALPALLDEVERLRGDEAEIRYVLNTTSSLRAVAQEAIRERDAFAAKVQQMREGLERIACKGDGRATILAAYPFALSVEDCRVASAILDGMQKIADNLLNGKRWDGSEVK